VLGVEVIIPTSQRNGMCGCGLGSSVWGQNPLTGCCEPLIRKVENFLWLAEQLMKVHGNQERLKF